MSMNTSSIVIYLARVHHSQFLHSLLMKGRGWDWRSRVCWSASVISYKHLVFALICAALTWRSQELRYPSGREPPSSSHSSSSLSTISCCSVMFLALSDTSIPVISCIAHCEQLVVWAWVLFIGFKITWSKMRSVWGYDVVRTREAGIKITVSIDESRRQWKGSGNDFIHQKYIIYHNTLI